MNYVFGRKGWNRSRNQSIINIHRTRRKKRAAAVGAAARSVVELGAIRVTVRRA